MNAWEKNVMRTQSQTQFVRNWEFEGADALKPGTRGRVYYHSPFFGKPFVAKVVWTNRSG